MPKSRFNGHPKPDNHGGARPNSGPEKTIEIKDGEVVGFRNLPKDQKNEKSAEYMRKYRAEPAEAPAPKKTKDENAAAYKVRLAERTRKKEEAADDESDEGEEEDNEEEETLDKDQADDIEEAEDRDEEDTNGVTLEEQVEQHGPGEKEGLLAKTAELICTYKKKASPQKNKIMERSLRSFYDKTRNGGKSYPLAFFYHPDVELHIDLEEEKNGSQLS